MQRVHAFFRKMAETAEHAMLLGGAPELSTLNRWVIMGLHARRTAMLSGDCLIVDGQTEQLIGPDQRARLFERLEAMRQSADRWPEEKARYHLPMAGGLAGCVGYGFYPWCDAGWEAAELPPDGWPDLLFCEFKDWLFVDLQNDTLIVLSRNTQRADEYRTLWNNMAEETLAVEEIPSLSPDALEAYLKTFSASFSQPDFETAVERLKENIRRGEIYQANLSIRLCKSLGLDPLALFETLCRRNPSPFSGFFQWPEGLIISNSPERLVRVDETGQTATRPIAGTRGRGQSIAEDNAIGQTLLENEKERAEHLMLVDLARNDLGRICRPGSVRVDELLVLERYSHVTHLVSNVVGDLAPGKTGWDVLRSLFPGGTVTGCPKIRCVNILDHAEPVPRGFYTGSMGYLDAASPALDFNILIRSLFLKPDTGASLRYNAAVHVGAGIVHDSVGAHEYRECLRKATAVLSVLRQTEQQGVLHEPAG